ncbi:MAG: hypothetical protein IKJ41_03275 [Clostridia bacterium]|nr:hypothetical protein [Clostridia bacterium]
MKKPKSSVKILNEVSNLKSIINCSCNLKIAEIEAVNPDKLTDEQEVEHGEIKAGFEALLDMIEESSKAQAEKHIEIINTPKEYFSHRFFCFIRDCLTWKYNGSLWLFSNIFGC